MTCINGIQHLPFRGRMIPTHDYLTIFLFERALEQMEAEGK